MFFHFPVLSSLRRGLFLCLVFHRISGEFGGFPLLDHTLAENAVRDRCSAEVGKVLAAIVTMLHADVRTVLSAAYHTASVVFPTGGAYWMRHSITASRYPRQ